MSREDIDEVEIDFAVSRRRMGRARPSEYYQIPYHIADKFRPFISLTQTVYPRPATIYEASPLVISRTGWESLYLVSSFSGVVTRWYDGKNMSWSDALYDVHRSIQLAFWLKTLTEEFRELDEAYQDEYIVNLRNRMDEHIVAVFGAPPKLRYTHTCERCTPVMMYRQYDVYICNDHLNATSSGALPSWALVFRWGRDSTIRKRFKKYGFGINLMIDAISRFGVRQDEENRMKILSYLYIYHNRQMILSDSDPARSSLLGSLSAAQYRFADAIELGKRYAKELDRESRHGQERQVI